MILGRGIAQTDEAIIAEYQQWVKEASHLHHWNFTKRLREGPDVMCKRIGKSIKAWTDEEILALYHQRTKATWTVYNSFLAFLFFRGYRQATIQLLAALQTDLSRHWSSFLLPVRQRIEHTAQELGYAQGDSSHVLNLLIWVLAVMGVPLDELTREAFEDFRERYQGWYRQKNNALDHRLYRLEQYLIHWGVFPAARKVLRHEELYATLRLKPFGEPFHCTCNGVMLHISHPPFTVLVPLYSLSSCGCKNNTLPAIASMR